MNLQFKSFTDEDTAQAIAIWNQFVTDGVAFPQTETLTLQTGKAFFKVQTYTGVAYQADTGQIVGLYILHPNNVGRCGHICNTSYAVDSHFRGQHIGEKLVRHSMGLLKNQDLEFFNSIPLSNQTKPHLPSIKNQASTNLE